jgi:signal transduction histidine kinase
MPAPELRPTRLQDVVDDILWLNREQCNARGIGLGWTRCDTVAPLPLDVQLIEPALLNIVKNAVEAIDERNARDGSKGGAIRVELEDLGERVRLSVIDSGGLLDAAPARQLFTPFFSTKRGGQGIGLMFVREVLQRHGCTFALAPGAAGETRFDIWFPIT